MKGYLRFYDGLAWIIKLIFAIIPLTGWVNAFLYRIGKGQLVVGIICIFIPPVAWLVDLVCVIIYGKPTLFV